MKPTQGVGQAAQPDTDDPTPTQPIAEALADAVEDFLFTEDRDEKKLRAAWQSYVDAADHFPAVVVPVCRCGDPWGDHSDEDGACCRCTCDQYDGPHPPVITVAR